MNLIVPSFASDRLLLLVEAILNESVSNSWYRTLLSVLVFHLNPFNTLPIWFVDSNVPAFNVPVFSTIIVFWFIN